MSVLDSLCSRPLSPGPAVDMRRHLLSWNFSIVFKSGSNHCLCDPGLAGMDHNSPILDVDQLVVNGMPFIVCAILEEDIFSDLVKLLLGWSCCQSFLQSH